MKRYGMVFLLGIGMIIMLASLITLGKSTSNSASFESMHVWLVFLNAGAAVALLAVIGFNLTRLLLQRSRNVAGSRLTLRLVGTFSLLAVVPVVLVYYFSYQFISRGIDSWFDVRVESALSGAMDLSRAALDMRVRDLLVRTERMSRSMNLGDSRQASYQLDQLRRQNGASELTLIGGFNNRIIASSSAVPGTLLPDMPGPEVMLQVRAGNEYVGLDPVAQGGLHIRAVVPVTTSGNAWWNRESLQALYPVGGEQSGLANQVQQAYAHYRELTVLRGPLKLMFNLTLLLVLLLSVLMSIWGAFVAARTLVAPIQALVEGTRAVARGDFTTRLPLTSRDEVGFLVSSFNEMTQRLAEAREAARKSREQVENERSYLGAVLTRLSSGVVSFNAALVLKTANPTASAILETDLHQYMGRSLVGLAKEDSLLGQFVAACRRHLDAEDKEWREEMVLQSAGGRRIFMVSCAMLPSTGEVPPGRVLVFDDLTLLIDAQRDAAWGEVARRLAHEIKNPLTPIQLAAERMRRRYLGVLKGEDADVMDRATNTIVQQVEAMKSMVNAFSEYARAPLLEMSAFDLNTLVREVVELYRVREADMQVTMELDPALPPIHADAGRVRQILHNLLKNAHEALEGRQDGQVRISSHYFRRSGEALAEVTVEDNGPGFDPVILGKAFEPYVTSKTKGTGLGLAIVKKLTEEHGGNIRLQNRAEGGAQIMIRLPLDEHTRSNQLLGANERRAGGRREAK
jgi:nitrogen fixation/metabolism regulation signal transduction histidine kinase